jgi:cell division protein ZipA
MDGLRWLLLLFGILVIAGVYFYSRRERDKPAEEPQPEQRVAPTLGDEPELQESGFEPTEDDAPAEPGERTGEIKQKIVTLRLIARDGGAFKGDELILSLRGIGMRHGKFGIFHQHDGNDESRTVFSAASLVEPGSFDLANIKDQEIPGISLFLVLPGPVEGVEAFDMMMESSRALAQSLDAELLDESGSTLSIQRERYMREEIIQYQHSNLVA